MSNAYANPTEKRALTEFGKHFGIIALFRGPHYTNINQTPFAHFASASFLVPTPIPYSHPFFSMQLP